MKDKGSRMQFIGSIKYFNKNTVIRIMRLNRQQLSLLITFLSMALMVLSLFNIHLRSEKGDDYIIELSLAEDDIDIPLEEQEKEMRDMANADPIKSHMAYNETAKPSYGNPEPLKTLDELMEEKESASGSDENKDFLSSESGYAANLRELERKRKEKQQLLGEKDAQKTERTNNLAKRRTSVSYSLIDRNSFRLPPPIYTCLDGGKVVVNIKVDALGNVTEAEFNGKSSDTSNGCLVDNAIIYAYRAKFNASDRASQKGSITYIFQGKPF